MKSMAIRIEDDLHTQLTVLAQLESTSITDVIRAAIEAHLEAKRHDPNLSAQADTVLADMDREASLRRDAISTLFATQPADPAPAAKRTGRKPSTPDSAPAE